MSMDTMSAGDEAEVALVRLFTSGPVVEPTPSVWAAIDAAIDADLAQPELVNTEPANTEPANTEFAKTDRMADGFWANTAPGVLTKLLWDGRSLLIQCDVGAVIPEHEHFAEERIMVISGDMIIDGRSYGSGDAVWMAKGTSHGVTTTKTGCVILISYAN